MTGTRPGTQRVVLGAIIVLIGMGAVLATVALVLTHYPVTAATATSPGDDHSSAVVAVLTPSLAAIGAVIGLYFGISATGSARGHEAAARLQEAVNAGTAPATQRGAAPSPPHEPPEEAGDPDLTPGIPAHAGPVPPDQGDAGAPTAEVAS